MKQLKHGAEAVIFQDNFLGRKVIVKQRNPKKYRARELDEKINSERIKKEALMIHKAKKIGVRTPFIFDLNRKEKKIVMEFIEGKTLKETLNKKNLIYCKELGKIISLMHKNNLIHGDLTTSNVIKAKDKGKELVLIDFGLSYESSKLEDKAVDLLNLKKTFLATHFKLKEGWQLILNEYEKESGIKISEKIKEIEGRARYS